MKRLQGWSISKGLAPYRHKPTMGENQSGSVHQSRQLEIRFHNRKAERYRSKEALFPLQPPLGAQRGKHNIVQNYCPDDWKFLYVLKRQAGHPNHNRLTSSSCSTPATCSTA